MAAHLLIGRALCSFLAARLTTVSLDNFSATDNTAEMCVGMVKAMGVYPKNPFQHGADLEMLERTPQFNPNTDARKEVECF